MARHIPRLYLGSYTLSSQQMVALVDEQHHYLTHVLRVQPGSTVVLFNEADGEWSCSVESISKTMVKIRILEQLRICKPLPETHLYFAPLRKERLMDVLEKGTELGVTHFHPIITDHTVHGRLNIEKLEIYIQDAAEQCGRCDMPKLMPATSIKTVLEQWTSSAPLFWALEAETLPPLSLSNPKESAHLAVGPEGGWSDLEKQQFRSLPFVTPFSLGSLTLRAETAAIASLALVSYIRTLG
jgi:16S rRNA (uracil1498-N3)-methyltransferase